LSLRTVRYYGEVGLVTPSARSDGGFRLYSEQDATRLAVVKRMRPLGLTLDQIGELLALIDRSADAETLDAVERNEVAAGLRSYTERCDEAIRKLERDRTQAYELRDSITASLARCGLADQRLAHP
jgi:DNA-binding transcriptional MerR regulator